MFTDHGKLASEHLGIDVVIDGAWHNYVFPILCFKIIVHVIHLYMIHSVFATIDSIATVFQLFVFVSFGVLLTPFVASYTTLVVTRHATLTLAILESTFGLG